MITLNSKAEKRLQQGHPWIFRSDLSIPENTLAGAVSLQNTSKKFLGLALYSPYSQIALRTLSAKNQSIDLNFFKQRITQAWERRKQLKLPSNAYRIVFGESDFIPSFILDFYNGALSFQILSAGLESCRGLVLQAVEEIFHPEILVERNDVSVRRLENLEQAQGLLKGEKSFIEIEEGSLRFEVDLLEGQKTGAFLDQRDNRMLASLLAQGKKKLLDACAYNGWFACHMAKKSAGKVIALDQSEKALQQVERNARLNQLNNIEVLCQNVFDYLKEADQRKEKFDLINLDPPAFVKSSSQLTQALKGYKEINLRAMKLLEAEGILITSSCSHHLSENLFIEVLQQAARDARRQVQILFRGQQGPDHPALLGFPESKYLKCFVLRVI
ncbi:MAG: class I SAM-dependent rRNA methyltransferase [Deltaproteobacteria bacterium]|nr:class I SAM-dependent rRNA methyltransferase [Deltaproteobacteria bacterium]